MVYKKIIYLRYLPLTEKIYKDFYMDELLKNSFIVEYWDLSKIFFKEIETISYEMESLKIKTFKSLKEVESELKNTNDKTLFISIMTFDGRVKNLFLLLTKYNCTLSVFGRNMFPTYIYKKSFASILKKVNYLSIINFLKTKYLIFLKKSNKIKNYDFLFLGGQNGWQGIGNHTKNELNNSTIIKVNSDDYDRFIETKSKPPFLNYEYILFLDEYLPLHPDTKLFKINNVKPHEYYPELNLFFDFIEKKYGLPIVIAAHPKAELYKQKNYFNGREVYFDCTSILTKFSTFVIAHDSTSINLPVSFKKYILFITSNNIKRSIPSVDDNVKNFSKYLGLKYYYFDNLKQDLNFDLNIPEIEYNNYKYNFQTWLETEEHLTKSIFINFLNNYSK